MKHALTLAVAALALAPLGACSKQEEKQASAPADPSGTLATAIARSANLSSAAQALKETGISGVFDGKGSYTLLAPVNEAFAAFGVVPGKAGDTEKRAALAAILRDHIVPGYLYPDDISRAIDASESGKVEMTTMGGHRLTFTKTPTGVVVSTEDGAQGTLARDAVVAANGVAIPLDAVLKALPRQASATQ